MTRVSNAGYECPHCTTYGTFGLARPDHQRLVEGQHVDARGLIHDPVFHQADCPVVAPALSRKDPS